MSTHNTKVNDTTKIYSALAILTTLGLNVLSFVLTALFTDEIWYPIIVASVISFFSVTAIILSKDKLVLWLWKLLNKQYDISGKWYLVYYYPKRAQDPTKDTRIRVGVITLKQEIAKVEAIGMQSWIFNPEKDFFFKEDEPTSASGISQIDFARGTLEGVYEVRPRDIKVDVLAVNRLNIHRPDIKEGDKTTKNKSPQKISGAFLNTMTHRTKLPHEGSLSLFKNLDEALAYAKESEQRIKHTADDNEQLKKMIT